MHDKNNIGIITCRNIVFSTPSKLENNTKKVKNIHFKLHTESISFARIVSFGDPIPWPIFYSCKLTPLSCHRKLYDLDLTKMLKSFFDYNNIHYNVLDGPFKNY